MALIYFYDATELDVVQLSKAMSGTDHHWEYVPNKISVDNINPETEVISVFVTSVVTKEIIDKLPNLKLIACRSTGFNNIDLQVASEKGITVTNVPSYGEATVAEYAFTLATALLRKLPDVLETENEQFDPITLRGTDLNNKNLGVIGTGRIGQHAIKIANGYGMRVLAYDAFPKDELQAELNFEYKSIEDVMRASDVITIHAPYLPSTHHLINAELISLMKPSAVLINTARGEIVETSALITALTENKIGGAALDVIEGEALLNHHEEITLLRSKDLAPEILRHSVEISLLKKMPNVIISPHNAFNTVEAVERINKTTAENITKYWYGETPNKIKPSEKTPGKLLLVRHTESEWNATGQWTGITDVHLDDVGFHEAAQLGLALKELGIKVSLSYCSEQIRTRETLEGILNASQQFDVDIVRAKALNERDYGDYTGKNKWEMKEILGESAFNDLRRGWNVEVPNGETLKMVYERAVPFYTDSILPLLRDGRNVLIVGHGNSIRALMKYIDSISDEDVENLEMLFGQIVIYDVDESGLAKHKSITKIDINPPNA